MWKSIKEWEGLYSINENGDIKNDKTGKLIVGDINNCGYYRVCLYDKQNNRKQRYFRHRLVAMHFLDNPDNYEQVNHIDGDKTNNNVNNLEWVSARDNDLHCMKVLKSRPYKPYKVVYANGEVVVYETKSELATILGVTITTIKHYLHGKSKGYLNYGIISINYI